MPTLPTAPFSYLCNPRQPCPPTPAVMVVDLTSLQPAAVLESVHVHPHPVSTLPTADVWEWPIAHATHLLVWGLLEWEAVGYEGGGNPLARGRLPSRRQMSGGRSDRAWWELGGWRGVELRTWDLTEVRHCEDGGAEKCSAWRTMPVEGTSSVLESEKGSWGLGHNSDSHTGLEWLFWMRWVIRQFVTWLRSGWWTGQDGGPVERAEGCGPVEVAHGRPSVGACRGAPEASLLCSVVLHTPRLLLGPSPIGVEG
ncbi:hypothetical protein B0H19DRAFT_1085007 [Mycena capillaripes]|nr:hypothetical protein B0H19DRAFT_1085007 [Mycena capillaripes]